ncbi:MAG: GTP pyrophosphokinase family protein [Clostridia bacterium]|nr:GTP pyrophosphokinase family protein [Clostridia bacterium]
MNDAKTLMTYYRCAIHEVETKFRVLEEEFSLSHERNPIEGIKSRLKSFDSIREKLERRNLPLTLESIEKNLNDVAGIRVVCSFVDDIYLLADCLVRQDDVKLIEKKDYIKSPKPNGYRSLHLIVEIPIFLCNEKKIVRVEVQLRTIAMESWARLEHRMRYKKSVDEKLLSQTADALLECAEISNKLDIKMQNIRNIIEGD